MPATPATDREPSPCPPCRSYFFALEEVACLAPSRGSTASCWPHAANDLDHWPTHGRFASAKSPRIAKRCSRAETSFAEFGRRRGCRGPRWAEARSPSPNKEVAAAGWAGARIAANRDVAGGRLRSASHVVERGPMASARRRSTLRSPRNPSRPGEDSGARERRTEPRPGLPLATTPPGTPAAQRRANSAAGESTQSTKEMPAESGHVQKRQRPQAANGIAIGRATEDTNRGAASMRRANASANARSACVSTSATSSTCAGAGSAASMHWNT